MIRVVVQARAFQAGKAVMGDVPAPVGAADVYPIRRVFLINAPEILPVPSDVRIGIPYGESGTEFTGTYDAGGGNASRVIGSPVVRRK
jgi:hypothetical protein